MIIIFNGPNGKVEENIRESRDIYIYISRICWADNILTAAAVNFVFKRSGTIRVEIQVEDIYKAPAVS